jgi:hypothetical protein
MIDISFILRAAKVVDFTDISKYICSFLAIFARCCTILHNLGFVYQSTPTPPYLGKKLGKLRLIVNIIKKCAKAKYTVCQA